ncbi:homogentisate 1,2-dioxygenase-domain-containing protein [Aspergillus arachidicola]|nr:homogentisate 1,2-dioxygenase-domain-containing protein [Aspergillus arachidicola]
MGLISGNYDAKTGGGVRPAGASLHNVMSAHDPDSDAFEAARRVKLKPQKVGDGSMACCLKVPSWLGCRMGSEVTTKLQRG